MKAAASAIVQLMGVLLMALPSMTNGAKESFTVSDGGVDFTINRYDDGRTMPSVITFTDLGLTSMYKFNTDGKVTQVIVDGDRYVVKYKNSGRIKTVVSTGAGRKLFEGVVNGIGATIDHTALASSGTTYPCGDCYEAWNEICSIGVGTVCDLVTYGEPFMAPAEASLDLVCSTLGSSCSYVSAGEACLDECQCLPPLTITLEWSGLSEDPENKPLFDLHVIEPTNKLVYYDTLQGDVGSLVEYENKRVYTGLPQLSHKTDSIEGYYLVFADWWQGSAPVTWAITAVDGRGVVLLTQAGQFTDECGSSTVSGSTGWSIATTELFFVSLGIFADDFFDCYTPDSNVPFISAGDNSPSRRAK